MPASLNSLPFDLMHVVASSLNIRDYVHLSRVSKRCYNLLQNESIAWKTLQVRC
jgi:F-box domain